MHSRKQLCKQKGTLGPCVPRSQSEDGKYQNNSPDPGQMASIRKNNRSRNEEHTMHKHGLRFWKTASHCSRCVQGSVQLLPHFISRFNFFWSQQVLLNLSRYLSEALLLMTSDGPICDTIELTRTLKQVISRGQSNANAINIQRFSRIVHVFLGCGRVSILSSEASLRSVQSLHETYICTKKQFPTSQFSQLQQIKHFCLETLFPDHIKGGV